MEVDVVVKHVESYNQIAVGRVEYTQCVNFPSCKLKPPSAKRTLYSPPVDDRNGNHVHCASLTR